ncbi:MAG: endonuclease V [Thermoproteota archaeon]|nr:endonuclease V [Thermoproteota archaeon]
MSIYSEVIELQKEIAKNVIAEDTLHKKIEYICGVDVSYKKNTAYCSAVIMKKNNLELIESVNAKSVVRHPYIPGLFILRESEPILNTLKLLKNHFDLLLIDGHGLLHPRKCGLASYIGVLIDRPTIGVAKSLLCGSIKKDQFIEYDDTVLGFTIKKEDKKQIYVSVGHKISLTTAIRIIKNLIKNEEWIPEPLRIADLNSKDHLNFDEDE